MIKRCEIVTGTGKKREVRVENDCNGGKKEREKINKYYFNERENKKYYLILLKFLPIPPSL